MLLAAAMRPAPAGARVENDEGAVCKVETESCFGVQRHSAPTVMFQEGLKPAEELEPATFANPGGSPVLHQNSTYAIFWDPDYLYLDPWVEVIDRFFQNMATASGSLKSVFAVDTQYTDKTDKPASYKSAFLGSYADKAPYPSAGCTDPNPFAEGQAVTCITDKQIREQLEAFIAREKLPKGMGTIYYLLTPPGVTVCTDAAASHCSDYSGAAENANPSYANSFCSYHAAITPTSPTTGDANTILYGVIPWSAGGYGDPLLAPLNRTSGVECQDGGFDPSSKPALEEKEVAKINPKEEEEKRLSEEGKKRATAEEEEGKEKTTYEEAFAKGLISEEEKEEKEEALKAHRKKREAAEQVAELKAEKAEKEAQKKKELLEGPHQEEPNQSASPDQPECPDNDYDGGCDVGLADIIITQIASEQQNIVTDPLLDAWQDKNHNEAVDECRNLFDLVLGGSSTANEYSLAGNLYNQTFGTGNYYLNNAFNVAALRMYQPGGECLNHVNLFPSFTAPTPVNAGEIVGLNGLESNVALNAAVDFPNGGAEKLTFATYAWNFGDGSPEVSGFGPGAPPCTETPWLSPCAASVFHSYTYGGTYYVTLTVTDVGGNTASVVHPITVVGPSPPSGGGSGTGSGTATPGASGGSGGSGASGKSSSTPSVPGPVATAAAVSTSLKQVAKSGLVVRYSVNEQVAGRFEVLLEAALAHRFGISGPAATNLPAGSPKSLVIGHALLVTTKGGKSSVRIKFSKSVAKHLRRASKVKLTLRLTAHNANPQNPLFTTVLSTVVLHR
jgi:PKD domain